MEEEIIIIVKPPQRQAAPGDSLTEAAGEACATVKTFQSRADAIAYLAGTEASDDRS